MSKSIKSGLEGWKGGSQGEMKRKQSSSSTGPVRGSDRSGTVSNRVSGASTKSEMGSRGGQSDRVRATSQTMPKNAKQARKGEYPWEVSGNSHNEVHDRQPSSGVNRQILEGQNFDQKELQGTKDLAFNESRVKGAKRGKLPKGQ